VIEQVRGQILFTVYNVVWKGRRRQIAARIEVRAGGNGNKKGDAALLRLADIL